MPSLVKLVRGKRYQFASTLVEHGEVVEVDARTRNRLVRSGYFVDVRDHERPAFVAIQEDDAPAQVQGGTDINNFDDPAITGAKPEPEVATGPIGARGDGKVHQRSGSEIAEARAAEAQQTADPTAENTEAQV